MNKYLNDLRWVLNNLLITELEDAVDLLSRARQGNRQIFIVGNGGSATTASHFACDLGKNLHTEGLPDFHVISLDNLCVLTAYANDEGYDNIYVKQISNLMKPGDVVIGISASGNSENICKAIKLARRLGAITVGFTGHNGGKLGKLVHLHLNAPSKDIKQIEDAHLVMTHMITRAME